jgi:hypothetical protein
MGPTSAVVVTTLAGLVSFFDWGNMEPKNLFLSVLDELRECVTAVDNKQGSEEYLAIRISRLLRQLLLDNSPLIDQINREFRLKIRYGVGYTWDDEYRLNPILARSYTKKTLGFWMATNSLYPPIAEKLGLLARRGGIKFLNRDEFLATPMMYVPDQFITARQLILHAANIKGGVHLGTPKSEADRATEAIYDSMFMVTTPVTLNAVVAIGRVVVDSLDPLRAAVTSKPK